MSDLKPCPFCQSTDVHTIDGGDCKAFSIICMNCEALGPEAGSVKLAGEAWNIRIDAASNEPD